MRELVFNKLSRKSNRIPLGHLSLALVFAVHASTAQANLEICTLALKAVRGEQPLTGEERFQLAQALKQTEHPEQSRTGGRSLSLPARDAQTRDAILRDLIKEFEKVYALEGPYKPTAATEDTPATHS